MSNQKTSRKMNRILTGAWSAQWSNEAMKQLSNEAVIFITICTIFGTVIFTYVLFNIYED